MGAHFQATGQFVDAYAEAHLFGPLGIQAYHWKKTPRGYPDTEGGLYSVARQVGVVNNWNLFGGGQAGILRPFITALVQADG